MMSLFQVRAHLNARGKVGVLLEVMSMSSTSSDNGKTMLPAVTLMSAGYDS